MSQFIMLTRVSNQSLDVPQSFENLERTAVQLVEEQCPDVKWLANYAVMGPYDYVDVFEAPDVDTAMRVSAIIRTHGQSRTEVWPAFQWKDFKQIVHELPAKAS